MTLDKDRFGWSLDIGRFVVRDGLTYTEYGTILEPGTLYREGFGAYEHENYADWTEEHRDKVLSSTKARVAEREKARQAELDERCKIVERARLKLTDEEYEAIRAEALEDSW
jgi:hypothetical protein